MGVKRVNLGPVFHPEKRGKTFHSDEWSLSELPDEILISVLSLLPLREAARTSVLSSRWVDLWRNSLRLNFEALHKIEQHPKSRINVERTKYIDWVNLVLESHKAPILEEFRCRFDLDELSGEAITMWLQFALARRVQKLELNLLEYDGYFDRSNSKYVYNFPVELLGRSAPIEPSMLKPLKALCLRAVNVTGEDIHFFLRNCPLLEQLIVQGSKKMSKVEVCGASLALKHLEIFDCYPRGYTIKISAPNLTSLKVKKLSGLLLENVPKLVEFYLACGSHYLYKHKLTHCCISQLEILTLDLILSKKLNLCVFPEMHKLKKLKIKYQVRSGEKISVLTTFIKASPHLQDFELEIMGMTWWCGDAKDEYVDIRFPEQHQHLKVFKLSGFYCYGRSSSDIEFVRKITNFVKIVSMNCSALQKIMVNPHYGDPEQPPRDIASVRKYEKQLQSHLPDHIQLLFLY